MSADLKEIINSFLDQLAAESKLSNELKEIRKLKKEYSEQVIKLMTEKNLNLVRISTHKDGPKDIRLKKRIKKISITPKLLQKTLESMNGEVVEPNLINSVLEKIQNSEQQEEIVSLAVKRLKVDEPDSASTTVLHE